DLAAALADALAAVGAHARRVAAWELHAAVVEGDERARALLALARLHRDELGDLEAARACLEEARRLSPTIEAEVADELRATAAGPAPRWGTAATASTATSSARSPTPTAASRRRSPTIRTRPTSRTRCARSRWRAASGASPPSWSTARCPRPRNPSRPRRSTS